MAGNIHADITPTGLGQKELVRLLYHFFAGLEGVAAKLDLDTNADDTYQADFNLVHNVIIEDDLGNRYQNVVAQSSSLGPVAAIGPKGLTDAALMDILYQLHFCFKDILTRAVADDLTTGTHLTTCWTGKITHQFVNRFGTMVGQGTAYYFRPGGVTDHKQVVEALYNYFYYWNVFCDQLDTDAVPGGVDYAAEWSDKILLRIRNGAGSVIGNTSTRLG